MASKKLRITTAGTPSSGFGHMDNIDEMEEGHSPYPDTPYSAVSERSDFEGSQFYDDDDDMLSSALGSDYGDDHHEKGRDWIDPDVLYGDEFMYWAVKLLRGQTTGRRIKRCVFKIMVVTVVCNIALLVQIYLIDRLYAMSAYFQTSPYGNSLSILLWMTCIPSLFMGVVSFMFLKYWASAVTNRKLFSQLCRIYMVGMIVCIGIGSWMIAVLLLMFKDVERWDTDFQLATIFPFYICINIFTWPYLIVTLYYTLDISYWMDELVNANGDIAEESPPSDTIDLSDVNLNQILMLVFAFPCLITVQIMDLIVALCKAIARYVRIRRRQMQEVAEHKRALREAEEIEARRGRSSLWDRIKRTVKRRWKQMCCCGSGASLPRQGATSPGLDDEWGPASLPSSPSKSPTGPSALASYGAPDRETQERLARERATEEQEKRLVARQAEIEAKLEEEAERAAAEKERLAKIEAAEAQKREEMERENSKPVLEVPSFRMVWGQLGTTGSFQCKLKATPSLVGLMDHVKRQGFHVVFASQPNSDEVELGICNIRDGGQGPWFLARFLAAQGSFSAVMKSQDPKITSGYVKKFALAKCLKIDTNHLRKTPIKSAGDRPLPEGGGNGNG